MKKTLVVMAAGMGSRFGGLKQITPVDEDGNFIIDYSVYDAKRAGFDKVVFVIKEENYEDFKNSIGSRLKDKIEVDYAFQKLSDIPSNIDISSRIKPWGTVQAVLCAKDKVEGSFVVVNADDFYGYDSFYQAAQFLDEHRADNEQACISYPFSVTKSDVGAVKRGVLKIEGDIISSIIESSIEVIDEKTALATPLDGSKAFKIDINAFVSMNMFAFQNYMFQLLEDYFQQFFLQDKEVVLSSEALLPECIKENIMNKNIVLYNKNSNGKWLGMTYKEDLEFVKREIRNLKNKGEYPSQLWR